MTSLRSALPLLAALALGVAACGGTEGGIPPSDADTLREELADVARFVEQERCDEVNAQVRQVSAAVTELPTSVDDALVANLNEGVATLEGAVADDCRQQAEERQQEELEQEEEQVPQEDPSTTEQPEEPEEEPLEEQPPLDDDPTTPDDGGTTPPADGDGGGGGGNSGGGNSGGGGSGGGPGPGAVLVPQEPTPGGSGP